MRIIREVIADLRFSCGAIVGEVLLPRLEGPIDGGGDEDNPSAARATCTGSRLGESFSMLLRL